MDLEHEYLPSLRVGEAGRIFQDWRQRAAATRAKLKFQADIRYGAHPRELMDFYPAENGRGCLVFIHGGYWQEFSKIETSWVAEGFVGQGLSVALVNYPLCPDVTIADIRGSCANAFGHLYKNVLSNAERDAVVVTGHSAGGYQAAAYLVEDWTRHNLPENPFAGVMPISGVFDVAPLMQTTINARLLITPASASALNLVNAAPRVEAKLVMVVGQQESMEFHRQSSELVKSWRALSPNFINVEDTNHFTIVDSLATPGAVLNRLAVALARR